MPSPRLHLALALATALALPFGWCKMARAQYLAADAGTPSAGVSLAESLYREGRRLMADERYAEAADKFSESNRLDPATGTLMNLAVCHVEMGKLASAWLEFTEALEAAQRDGRDDRVRYIERRLLEIEPRLSYLTIDVPSEARVRGLEVHLDGVRVGPAAYGVQTPIDVGRHLVTASAPGRNTWSTDVLIAGDGRRQLVTVESPAPKPATLPPPKLARLGVPAPAMAAETSGEVDAAPQRPIPVAAYVAGGATLLWLGAAVVTSVIYVNRADAYETDYQNPAVSDRQIALDYAANDHLGHVNAGLWGLAAASAALTTYLYATRPSLPRPKPSRVAAWATSAGGGVSVQSQF